MDFWWFWSTKSAEIFIEKLPGCAAVSAGTAACCARLCASADAWLILLRKTSKDMAIPCKSFQVSERLPEYSGFQSRERERERDARRCPEKTSGFPVPVLFARWSWPWPAVQGLAAFHGMPFPLFYCVEVRCWVVLQCSSCVWKALPLSSMIGICRLIWGLVCSGKPHSRFGARWILPGNICSRVSCGGCLGILLSVFRWQQCCGGISLPLKGCVAKSRTSKQGVPSRKLT